MPLRHLFETTVARCIAEGLIADTADGTEPILGWLFDGNIANTKQHAISKLVRKRKGCSSPIFNASSA